MSVLKQKQTNYGLTGSLPNLSPKPIIAKRAPSSTDKAEIGSKWIDKSTNTYYMLTNIVNASAHWIAQGANLYAGEGAPKFAAPKGSLYSRTDGSSIATRLYICSAATGTWVNVKTSA